jgi:hypothetical protein
MLEARPPSPAAVTRVGPLALYTTQSLTPGKADTLDVSDLTRRYTDNCPRHMESCTYSQDHRNVPKEEHDQVYNEYNVPDS